MCGDTSLCLWDAIFWFPFFLVLVLRRCLALSRAELMNKALHAKKKSMTSNQSKCCPFLFSLFLSILLSSLVSFNNLQLIYFYFFLIKKWLNNINSSIITRNSDGNMVAFSNFSIDSIRRILIWSSVRSNWLWKADHRLSIFVVLSV